MDAWEMLCQAARQVQNPRVLSPFVEAGGVAAALLTRAGNVYVGVCIDTACSLGMCAERNAIANMITHGEQQAEKLVALLPDGTPGTPCGACREVLMQLDRENGEMQILLDYDTRRTVTLRELLPAWWGEARFPSGMSSPNTN